jgi:hypothetical protein
MYLFNIFPWKFFYLWISFKVLKWLVWISMLQTRFVWGLNIYQINEYCWQFGEATDGYREGNFTIWRLYAWIPVFMPPLLSVTLVLANYSNPLYLFFSPKNKDNNFCYLKNCLRIEWTQGH